jgi:hypothetical protein
MIIYKTVGVKPPTYEILRELKYKTACNYEKIMEVAIDRLFKDYNNGFNWFDGQKESEREMTKAI